MDNSDRFNNTSTATGILIIGDGSKVGDYLEGLEAGLDLDALEDAEYYTL
jgi:hypothetical protein